MKKILRLALALALGIALPLLMGEAALAAEISGQTKGVWPANEVPADLPPYTDGELTGWGSSGKNEYRLKVMNTGWEALKTYLETLRTGGWDVDASEARKEGVAIKGLHKVELKVAFGGVQIAIFTSEKGAWPGGDKIPAALTPPAGCDLAEVALDDRPDDAWFFTFTCLGMSEVEARAYFAALRGGIWSGDHTAISCDTPWRGRPYQLTMEIYETVGGKAKFTVDIYPE
jgi:hypothetical protein